MNGHLRLCTVLLLICAPLMGVADEFPLEPARPSTDPLPRSAGSADAGLVEPESLRSAVAFWMRVYLEATTEAGLLHDSRHLGVVYETVRFGDVKGRRARQRFGVGSG